MYPNTYKKSQTDFNNLKWKLLNQKPFIFVRFSDGELEIIRNNYLEISKKKIIWSGGVGNHKLPIYDRKTFNPKKNQLFRVDLLKTALENKINYFKGVPGSHNSVLDRDLMIRLHGEYNNNLTFADLFLNNNFKKFRTEIIPLFKKFKKVVVIGNFRMKPKKYNSKWHHLKIPDNFFKNYNNVKKQVIAKINKLPKNCLILCSASSLSNILGNYVLSTRKDLTFFDIGTSMHDLMGLKFGIRGYHSNLKNKKKPNVLKNLLSFIFHSEKMVW